jgi:NADH-quinone oxidoreductase E subunit
METEQILKKYPATKDNLLMILHEIQNQRADNNISEEDIKKIAGYLNTTYSSVYGVITYYSMLSLKPRGRNIIRFCKSPLCRMLGAFDMLSILEKELNIKMGETTRDKLFSLEPTECLGQCDKAPVMMINEELYTDLTPEKIRSILKDYR